MVIKLPHAKSVVKNFEMNTFNGKTGMLTKKTSFKTAGDQNNLT